MELWLSLLFSLMLTSFVSFAIPIVFCFVSLGILNLICHLNNVLGLWGNLIYEQVWNFLAVFGEGSAWTGILVISVVSAVAGFIFESLNFYRYQTLIEKKLPDYHWQPEKVVQIVSKIINCLYK